MDVKNKNDFEILQNQIKEIDHLLMLEKKFSQLVIECILHHPDAPDDLKKKVYFIYQMYEVSDFSKIKE